MSDADVSSKSGMDNESSPVMTSSIGSVSPFQPLNHGSTDIVSIGMPQSANHPQHNYSASAPAVYRMPFPSFPLDSCPAYLDAGWQGPPDYQAVSYRQDGITFDNAFNWNAICNEQPRHVMGLPGDDAFFPTSFSSASQLPNFLPPTNSITSAPWTAPNHDMTLQGMSHQDRPRHPSLSFSQSTFNSPTVTPLPHAGSASPEDLHLVFVPDDSMSTSDDYSSAPISVLNSPIPGPRYIKTEPMPISQLSQQAMPRDYHGSTNIKLEYDDAGYGTCAASDSEYRQSPAQATPPPSYNAAYTSEERKRQDDFIVRKRREGMTYKAIQKAGCFREAEATLRGRYREATKPKEERVRKPVWKPKDVTLLGRVVHRLAREDLSQQEEDDLVLLEEQVHRKSAKAVKEFGARVRWNDVSELMRKNGASYKFAGATCKKKWQETVYGPGFRRKSSSSAA